MPFTFRSFMAWSLAMLLSGSALAQAPSSGGLLLVANKGTNSLGVIDLAQGKQVADIPEGGITGHEVTASPDGTLAYVPIYGSGGVGMAGTDGSNMVVIDISHRKVVGNVDFGKGVRPHMTVFGPKDGLLYVSTELDRSLTIVDPATLQIVGRVPTGQEQSHMFSVTRDGKRAYTANVGSGTVSVLDLTARKAITIIPVSNRVQRMSLSIDERYAFTSDGTKAQLAVIDTATHQVKTFVPLPGFGYGSAPTPDGKWLLVAAPFANKVGVVDVQNLSLARTIDLPPAPQEVVVSPKNDVAYVSCDRSGKIAVISLADWKVKSLIDAGPMVDGLALVLPK